MPMPKNDSKGQSFRQQQQKQREDQANRILNLSMRMQEALDVATTWEKMNPVEAPATYKRSNAPTTNSARPRARKIAYSPEEMRLIVVFRDGTWWEYRDIPSNFWTGLKASDSTGKYLSGSGLDGHDDMGPCDPSSLPEEIRVFLNS
jgi:hypothetical protein